MWTRGLTVFGTPVFAEKSRIVHRCSVTCCARAAARWRSWSLRWLVHQTPDGSLSV
jgi:hypothetical protein